MAAFPTSRAAPCSGWRQTSPTAPCAIAIAVAVDRSRVWKQLPDTIKILVTVGLCLGLVAASSERPLGIWSSYLASPRLDLPGTGLMRIDADKQLELQRVVEVLHANCDTFYGVPDEISEYLVPNPIIRKDLETGSVYADAGGLYDYKGPTTWAQTGELTTGPHLHFELWSDGNPVNPKAYINF